MKPLMTWNSKQGRWFKKYRHQQYTVSPSTLKTPPTKEGSIKAANEWWEAKQRELDQQSAALPRDWERLRVEYDKRHGWAVANGDQQAADQYSPEAFEAHRNSGDPPTIDAWWAPTENIQAHIWRDRLDHHKPKTDPEKSVGANVKDFLDSKKRSITLGEVSKDRWDALRTSLEQWRDWTGADTLLDTIDEGGLVKYRNHLIDVIEAGNLSTYTARDRLDAVRQFLRDRWRLHKLDNLPRNVDSKDLAIKVKTPKIKTFTIEEVKALLSKASERTKLYLLLMLNCGYLQSDIAELQQDEVDWKGGYIERKREKTKRFQNVPKVKYKLWAETLDLLKKHRSTDPDRVLLSETGEALRKVWIKGNGKAGKTSAISEAWKRLAKKTKTDKPVKLIRKTSSDLMDGHPEYGRYSIHFLGQSPRGVALKHYITPKQDQFDAALGWLATQYGVK